MTLQYQTSVLGKADVRGGALCKVWLYHDASNMTPQEATSTLTKLKQNLTDEGYQVVRASPTRSFRPDADGERTLESIFGSRCLSMLFTHRNSDLSNETLAKDVDAGFTKERPAKPKAGAGTGAKGDRLES